MKNNAISQGLISLTPYSGQINSALDYGNIIGKKYGIGKKKKAKKTKKAKKAKWFIKKLKYHIILKL